jgi:hypothetical protein
MLTIAQLRQAAAQSGARDIAFVEIDVMLTHLLQLGGLTVETPAFP